MPGIPANTGKMSLLLIALICFVASAFCNCDSEIYCRGPILQVIQSSGIFKDSKKYVDMPTSKSKAAVRIERY